MSGSSTFSTDVDALFALPLDEFVSARNALAAQLKKAGRHAEASDVKALAKPSVSAWVVNQVYWRHRGLFNKLIEAGDRMRRAQAAPVTGGSALEPANARREAVTALTKIAEGLLLGGDYGATRDMLRRVSSTLEALSSYGSLPGAPLTGRLTDDVEPPGFEALAGFPLGGTGRAARATAEPPNKLRHRAVTAARHQNERRKDQVAAAKATLRHAERALRSARKQAERATAGLENAAKRAKGIEVQRARIEKRLARVSAGAEAAQERAREGAAKASEAMRVVEASERALELARQRLREVEGSGPDGKG
jgi:hypothetical protein